MSRAESTADAPLDRTNGFDTLKAILQDLSLDYEETDPLKLEIETVLQDIEPEVNSASLGRGSKNEASLRQLQSDLKSTRKDLRSGYESPVSRAAKEYRIRARELLDNPQLATSLYSGLQQKAINDELNRNDGKLESALEVMRPLLRAKYSYSGGNHHCEEGTRTDILDEIGLWKRDFTKPPIYWLNGLAGTGKTTIANTVRGSRREGFSAFLFFSEISKENSNRGRVITELAYQLAFRHPEFRSMLILLLGSNPGIVDGLPSDQVKELIVEPLKKSAISTIILIEALDECEDKETVSAILSALKEIVSENKKVKFLITSRPKPHIQEAFLDLAKSRKVTISILHDSSQVNKDIRLFFTNQISKLNCINQIDFPGESVSLSEEQLDELCEAAGGLFVYAVEIARSWYNKHLTHAMILQSLKNIPARKTICSLYTSALVDAFDDCGPEQDQIIRSILGAVVLAETSLSPSTIATLLDLDLEHVLFCLQPVQSLLILQEGSNGLVQPFHKSFPTFCHEYEYLLQR